MVIEQVTNWAKRLDRTFTPQEIAEALEWVIGEGYAQAYLLSSQPPYSTQVSFSRDHLGDQWFYVTPQGKKLVKDMEDEAKQ